MNDVVVCGLAVLFVGSWGTAEEVERGERPVRGLVTAAAGVAMVILGALG